MAKDIEGSELNQMMSVVQKYYEMGMNQEEIAKEEYISKSSVCRLIKKAVKNGYVRFQINYPLESVKTLEAQFHKYFDLDKVFITPSYIDDEEVRLKDTCKSVAADICKIVQAEDTICVSWGTTLDQLASIITKEVAANKKCSKIVMMNGSTAGDISSTKSSRIVEQFAEFFAAEGFLLPVPLIVDNQGIANALKSDSHIKYVMEYAAQSQLAVMSIGATTQNSVLRKRGAYSKKEYDEVLALGAVGDIAGRCFNIDGNHVSDGIEQRIIGLTLEEIKSKKVRIGVAVGKKKAKAIIGALHGGIINRLYTDELTAQEVIKVLKNIKSEENR